tara:strand:- start:401 stop:829 length:429 start_codon:yes stop_codon:yes gene_type:complete
VPNRLITSLIYVSTARPGLAEEDLLAIQISAQRNNARCGITGLILFNGFNFIQCIEGDRASANECLNRIERDDRHSGMTVVSHGEISSPQFSQWRMFGPLLPAQSEWAQAGLDQLLAGDAVTDATRTLFQSFGSLGAKTPGR